MNQHKKAFTLVELIVVITILAILGTIAFISLQGYSADARDSKRISDIASMRKSLDLYKLRNESYPTPSTPTEVVYDNGPVYKIGTFGDSVIKEIRNISNVPTDPQTESEYTYSLANNGREYEIGAIMENTQANNTKLTNKASAAGQTAYVKGNYNGAVLKVEGDTSTYILALPSLINNDLTDASLQSIFDNSKIVYNGKSNLPGSYSGTSVEVQATTPETLTTNLVIYSGEIDDIVNTDFISALQTAYQTSDITDNSTIANIINTTETSNQETLAGNLINSYLEGNVMIVDTSCGGIVTGGTKDFYSVGSVEAGQSCDTVKKTFTCENTVWKDGINDADLETYSYESCIVEDDIAAPTGGDFTIPTTTNTESITLTIICPTDAAGSTPIEMYVSGDIIDTPIWEECTTSKNVTLTSGDGYKTISVKFRDSVLNETNNIDSQIVYFSFVGCTNPVVIGDNITGDVLNGCGVYTTSESPVSEYSYTEGISVGSICNSDGCRRGSDDNYIKATAHVICYSYGFKGYINYTLSPLVHNSYNVACGPENPYMWCKGTSVDNYDTFKISYVVCAK